MSKDSISMDPKSGVVKILLFWGKTRKVLSVRICTPNQWCLLDFERSYKFHFYMTTKADQHCNQVCACCARFWLKIWSMHDFACDFYSCVALSLEYDLEKYLKLCSDKEAGNEFRMRYEMRTLVDTE